MPTTQPFPFQSSSEIEKDNKGPNTSFDALVTVVSEELAAIKQKASTNNG